MNKHKDPDFNFAHNPNFDKLGYAKGPSDPRERQKYFHQMGHQGAASGWNARDIADHIVEHRISPEDRKHVRQGFKDFHGLRDDQYKEGE